MNDLDLDAIINSFNVDAILDEMSADIANFSIDPIVNFVDADLDLTLSVDGQNIESLGGTAMLAATDNNLFAGVYNPGMWDYYVDEKLDDQYSLITNYIHDSIVSNNLVYDSKYNIVSASINNANTTITTLQQVTATHTGAIALIEGRLSTKISDLEVSTEASIHTLSVVTSSLESSQATQKTELLSTMKTKDDELLSLLDESFETFSDAHLTYARKMTLLESSINGKSAQIEQLYQTSATLDGDIIRLKSEASVIMNTNGHISGWKVADDSATYSTFDIYADVFRITNGSTTIAPFSIVNGTVYVGGDSMTPIVHIGSFATAPNAANYPINSVYSNTTDGNSYIKKQSGAWELLAKAGTDGTDGIAGVSYYTWVKYAIDANGANMSDYPDGKTYLGIAYNKTTPIESTTPSDYTWSLIKGIDGIPGAKGADGVTLYTWIKYADDANGTGMNDYPDGKKYIGVAVNKTTASESNTASDYTWALIKGTDGVRGSTECVVNSTYTSNAQTSADFTSLTGYTNKLFGDAVTYIGNTSTPTAKYYRLANGGDNWSKVSLYVSGDAIVTGTIAAARLQISGIPITDLSGYSTLNTAVTTATNNANAAKTAADAAALAAANATTFITRASEDGWLTKSEKIELKPIVLAMVNEINGLKTQANNLGLTAQATNLNTAYNNLINYLSSTAGYNDIAVDTSIDRTVFNGYFSGYYISKQALLDAVAAKMKEIIPTSTSQLSNNSGYITTASLASYATQTAIDAQLANYASQAWVQGKNYLLPAGVESAIANNVTTIDGSKITTGYIAAGRINVGTITTDHIRANNIARGASHSCANMDISTNWASVLDLVYSNIFTREVQVLVTFTGRTSWGQGTVGHEGRTDFQLLQDWTSKFRYGETPMSQDAKAGSFATTIPANTTVTFRVYPVKINDHNDTCRMSGTLSVIGIVS